MFGFQEALNNTKSVYEIHKSPYTYNYIGRQLNKKNSGNEISIF